MKWSKEASWAGSTLQTFDTAISEMTRKKMKIEVAAFPRSSSDVSLWEATVHRQVERQFGEEDLAGASLGGDFSP